MKLRELFIAGIAAAVALCVGAANAAFTGYLKIDDIPGESQRAASVGGSQTQTIGANQSQTIKGGEAVIIGALWNGKDTPPRRNSKGEATITLKRGALSESLQRLHREQRIIPSMTLSLVGDDGKQTAYELKNVIISSWSSSAAAEQVSLYYNRIAFNYSSN